MFAATAILKKRLWLRKSARGSVIDSDSVKDNLKGGQRNKCLYMEDGQQPLTSSLLFTFQNVIHVAAQCVDQVFQFASQNLDSIGLPLVPRFFECLRRVVLWHLVSFSCLDRRTPFLSFFLIVFSCSDDRNCVHRYEAEIANILQKRWCHYMFDWFTLPSAAGGSRGHGHCHLDHLGPPPTLQQPWHLGVWGLVFVIA